ncbi:MAG: DUF1822 family protein [Oscillatoriales cyanobacterium RM1_1_9]|nr:DUF1822 family protein [Oscillatoriales cyanobacterium RM1_1_9]
MYDFSAHFPETDLDFSIFPVHFDGSDPGQIQELSPQQVQQAAQLSQPIQDVSRQWQHYLNALALSGFENWLASRDQNLSIDREHSSIYQPEIAQIIDSVCCVKVGQFKICLINFGKLAGETVQVPRAIFDLPEYTAHFYVLMKVQEELETVIISGFLSHQTWIEQQHQAPLQPNSRLDLFGTVSLV